MGHFLIRYFGLCLAFAGLTACGEQREVGALTPKPDRTYLRDIKPLLARACLSCHRGKKAEGGYDLSDWRGLFGPGKDDVRNAVPGDANSKLLTVLTDADHKGKLTAKEQLLLEQWVKLDKLAYFDSRNHPPTWLYPGDRNARAFHGGELRLNKWDMTPCKSCHGDDLRGGKSGKSCESCHQGGPTGCGTCHGSPGTNGWPPPDLSWQVDPTKPGNGAHQKHLTTKTFTAISCKDCHFVPTKLEDAKHLYDQGKTTDLKAELTFGPRAKINGVQAAYDAKSGSCTVYCHGAKFVTASPGTKPTWTTPKSGQCGSCHDTPGTVGGPDCAACHPQSVALCTPGSGETCQAIPGSPKIGIRFLQAGFHGDGKAPLGRKGFEGTCWSCHGTQATAGAPGPDLHGKTDISEVTVGLHALHLADGTDSKAIACADCHLEPKNDGDKGHYDSALPAELVFSDVARGKKADKSVDLKPAWDRKTATCSNVYCHSLDGATVTSWTWTKKVPGGLTCTSCHGNPPLKTVSGGVHSSGTACDACHSAAYNSGALDPSKHINGEVDL